MECLTKRGESAGDCTFTIERPKTRGIDTDAARRLEIRAPEYGAVLEDEGELSFAVDGSREVLFVLVLRGLPEPSGVDVSQRLVWGAALARATASETRHVFWSEGHDISEGEWLSGPASATPRNEDLFAFAVGVDNGNVVAATDELLLFRVGRGWAIPDVTDCSDVAINEPASGAAAVEGCAHPTQVMGCVAGTCRRLCLSSLDCGEQQECVIHETLGTRYCR